MQELRREIDRLMRRVDQMGLHAERAVAEALEALREGSVRGGQRVDAGDSLIDREEVNIQQECIRLLALYQPAAGDLRTIVSVIQITNDLERIGDIAVRIGHRVKYAQAQRVDVEQYDEFDQLASQTTRLLSRTVRLLTAPDAGEAQDIIAADAEIDSTYHRFMRAAMGSERFQPDGGEALVTLMVLARALERIGDHCTNIAEDVVFLRTGQVLRHVASAEYAGDEEA